MNKVCRSDEFRKRFSTVKRLGSQGGVFRARSTPRHAGRSTRFTLIELLVCIAVIMILLAMLMPVLSRVRAKAVDVTCKSNMRQWGVALHTYAEKNDGSFPRQDIRVRAVADMPSGMDLSFYRIMTEDYGIPRAPSSFWDCPFKKKPRSEERIMTEFSPAFLRFGYFYWVYRRDANSGYPYDPHSSPRRISSKDGHDNPMLTDNIQEKTTTKVIYYIHYKEGGVLPRQINQLFSDGRVEYKLGKDLSRAYTGNSWSAWK